MQLPLRTLCNKAILSSIFLKYLLIVTWNSGVDLIRLGYFLHRTPSGKLLVKMTVKKPPRLGSRVVNSGGKLIGKVVDVIGPVKTPYAVVKPIRKDLELRNYEELYIRPTARRFRK